MPASLAVINAPTSAGAYAPGQEKAPRALHDAGLFARLGQAGLDVRDHSSIPIWRWQPDWVNRYAQNLAAVVENAAAVATYVRGALQDGAVVLVLGGDCTVGLGTVAGHLPAHPRIGLIYFDLHADLNTPHSEPDGALDWMGMAHLLGEEEAMAELSRFGPRYPLLAPEQVLLFAYDADHGTAWERATIERRALATIPVEAVAANPEGAAAQALAHIQARCDRLLVHFDVDVIDFTDAPLSENTGRNTGLAFDAAFRALRMLLASDRLSALTITELNPDHGAEDGSTLRAFVDGLTHALAVSPLLV